MAVICSCESRRKAMQSGEMAQDRWGRWQFPIDTIAVSFRQAYPARYMSLTHCPFGNELLPNVSDAHRAPWEQPPAADATGDGEGQADGD